MSVRCLFRTVAATTAARAAAPAPVRKTTLSLSRSYVTRAHPKPIPEFPVPNALQTLLEDAHQRAVKREQNWIRDAEKRKERKLKAGADAAEARADEGPFRNQDETVSLAFNLNLDPRRQGQALRGSIVLPHGTGKTVKSMVFTNDAQLAESARNVGGAMYAGGEDLIENIANGQVSIESIDRSLAMQDILPALSKSLARTLGPRGLMPNAKVGTIFNNPDELLDSLKEQSKRVQYRTEKSGIVHVPVGKASFGVEKLMDNIKAVCNELQAAKPEKYGKGAKKTSKNAKYWLRATVSATQGRGIRLDLRSVDPSSPYFMKDPDNL